MTPRFGSRSIPNRTEHDVVWVPDVIANPNPQQQLEESGHVSALPYFRFYITVLLRMVPISAN